MGVDFRDIQETIFVGPNKELYHSGTKGMKWGIRKYQNKDGSLTPAGKIRYGRGSGPNVSRADRKFVDKINRSKEKIEGKHLDKEKLFIEPTPEKVLKYRKELTNKEISDCLNRIRMTQELQKFSAKEKHKGWQIIDNIITKESKVNNLIATTAILYGTAHKVKKILDKKFS